MADAHVTIHVTGAAATVNVNVNPASLQGPKGDAFTYEDFTPEQLEGLRGPRGIQGEKGEKGDAFEYDDFTAEQLEGLRGPKGDPFTYNDFTQEQLEGLRGPRGIQGEKGEKGDAFEYDDFTAEQLESLRGPKGDPGTPVVDVVLPDGIDAVSGAAVAAYVDLKLEQLGFYAHIVEQPADVTAVVNGNATFSVAATGEGLTYQWQVLIRGTAEWVDTSANGNQTSTVTMTTEIFKNGYRYRCIITDKYGNQKISDAATLTVVPILITKQPEDFTGVQGDTVVFSVEAEGNGLIYQWEYNTGNGWNNNTINETAQTSELSFIARPYHNGYKYRCLITDANGNTLRTDEVTMTVPGG